MARSKKPQPQEPKSLQELAREVFMTSAGSQFLEELHRIYVDRDQFRSDPYDMARRIGEAGLVLRLVFLANAKPLEDDLEYLNDGSTADTDA